MLPPPALPDAWWTSAPSGPCSSTTGRLDVPPGVHALRAVLRRVMPNQGVPQSIPVGFPQAPPSTPRSAQRHSFFLADDEEWSEAGSCWESEDEDSDGLLTPHSDLDESNLLLTARDDAAEEDPASSSSLFGVKARLPTFFEDLSKAGKIADPVPRRPLLLRRPNLTTLPRLETLPRSHSTPPTHSEDRALGRTSNLESVAPGLAGREGAAEVSVAA